MKCFNSHSKEILAAARADPGRAGAAPGTRLQCERLGYFCVDLDSRPVDLVFNRTTG